MITGTLNIDGKTYTFTAVPEGETAGRRHDQREAPAASGKFPDLPDEYKTAMVKLSRGGSKSGSSKKGAYTRFFACDEQDDVWYSTFDTHLGAELLRLSESGEEKRLAYTESDYGRTFVGFPASEQPSQQRSTAAATAPAQPKPKSVDSTYDPDSDNVPF